MRGDLVFLLLLGFLVFSVQERWVEEIPMVKHDHLLCEKSNTIEAVQLKGKKRGHSYSGPLQLQVRFKSTTKCHSPFIRARISGSAAFLLDMSPKFDFDKLETPVGDESSLSFYEKTFICPISGQYYLEVLLIFCDFNEKDFSKNSIVQIDLCSPTVWAFPFYYTSSSSSSFMMAEFFPRGYWLHKTQVQFQSESSNFILSPSHYVPSSPSSSSSSFPVSSSSLSEISPELYDYFSSPNNFHKKEWRLPHNRTDSLPNPSQFYGKKIPFDPQSHPPSEIPFPLFTRYQVEYKVIKRRFQKDEIEKEHVYWGGTFDQQLDYLWKSSTNLQQILPTISSERESHICFVGDSHTRDLVVIARKISNYCCYHTMSRFPQEFPPEEKEHQIKCRVTLVAYGQWPASEIHYPDFHQRPMPYGDWKSNLTHVVQKLKNDPKRWGFPALLSMNENSFGNGKLVLGKLKDHRHPWLIQRYNSISQQVCQENSISFINLQPVLGGMWDGGRDYCHFTQHINFALAAEMFVQVSQLLKSKES